MITLWYDTRYAFRQFIKHPGFTVAVVLILSIGIGVNTAIFSVVNAVLFKSLPYDEADKIVMIREQNLQMGLDNLPSSHDTLAYWRQHNRVFENIVGVEGRRFYVTGLEKPRDILASAVSPGYFSVMGMRPMLGREFLPEEEKPGSGHVVVLSFAFWREYTGGNSQAIGQSLILNSESYTIVGVMPAAFRDRLQYCAPFWVPLILKLGPIIMDEGDGGGGGGGGGGGTYVRARLKPGVILDQAQAHMDVLEEQLVKMDEYMGIGHTVALQRFLDAQLADSRFPLYLLWGSVGLVLLITCTNASGLFLVHSSVRRQEMAVRSALGASRGQIMRHMLTEGVILSMAGGVIGVLLAYWAIRALVRVSPMDIPRMQETRIDIPVLCFALGISVVTGLALSLLPAWKATGTRPIHALKQGQHGVFDGRYHRHAHGGLVVAQIAIAMTLLMAVAMLTQSLISMQRVDLGFEPANVLVADILLPEVKYPQNSHMRNFYQQLLPHVQASPGVRSAALLVLGGVLPTHARGLMPFSIDGRPPIDPTEIRTARVKFVSRDFFKTMGIPILKGPAFTDEDHQVGMSGIVIDENLARKYFPEEDPIGLLIDGQPIVGIARTLKDYSELNPVTNTIYWPWFPCRISAIAVRAEGDVSRLTSMIRAQISSIDKDVEIRSIRTLTSDLAEMLAPRRYTTILLGLFAQIALILAVVGLFGLLQYTVTRRTHEIGVRMALGATQASITQTFLRQSVRLILLGIIAGLLGGYIASRLMKSLIYETSSTDPAMLAITLSFLVSTALLASYLPARRAAQIDPMEALRYE